MQCILFLTKYDKIISFSKRLKIEQNPVKIEEDFKIYSTRIFDFKFQVNSFQSEKTSAQVSAVSQLTVSY